AAFDARDAPRVHLDQRDETFVPHVLAIVAGTTVEFPNSDQTYHNVFSLSKTKSFDLGRYAVGRSKSVRFDRPGIVRVFCDIHSHMSAFILVFSHRYFSLADEDGRYRLENVPPGTYNVMAWNESAPLESRKVVIPETGGEVELNVALGRR
ncbi:MAG: carboxypeptidase regulatory-like domain-containing protein, partial [Acidobacteriota bacterium]